MAAIEKRENISSSSIQCWVCMELKAYSVKETEVKPKATRSFNKNEQLISETIEKLMIKRPNLATIYEKVEDADKENLTQFPKICSIVCRGCKMQRYCCLNHMNKDRSQHRDICAILTDLQKMSEVAHPLMLLQQGAIFSIQQLQRSIGLLKFVARVKLRRSLTWREHDLIGFPALCQICFKLEKLRACGVCGAVAYCSEEHGQLDMKKHTPEVCRTLALLYSPYRYPTDNVQIADIPIDIMTDQLEMCLEKSHLVDVFAKVTGILVNDSPWNTLQDFQRFAACSSFSGIVSICLALNHVSFTAQPQDMCTVYIVDPTDKQIQRYFQEIHLKFFFLIYKDICQLDLYLIGNQIKKQKENYTSETITFEFQGHKRTVTKYFYPIKFKEFACIHHIDPVLIILFDIDLYGLYAIREQIMAKINNISVPKNQENQKDKWVKCLAEILCIYSVPICFTSLTKDLCQSNYATILELANQNGIEVKRCYRGNVNENPYREILPERNEYPEVPETVIYANNYLEVIFTIPKQ